MNTSVRLEQSAKAPFPILLTLGKNVIVVRFALFLNALSDIFTSESDIITNVSPVESAGVNVRFPNVSDVDILDSFNVNDIAASIIISV
jgi:hypothetical protein